MYVTGSVQTLHVCIQILTHFIIGIFIIMVKRPNMNIESFLHSQSHTYVHTYVRMYIRMYIRMYVCTYVYVAT